MRIAKTFAVMTALLTAGAAQAQDLFTGTVHVHEGVAWMDRCDLGGTRYILRDVEAGRPVADLTAKLATLKGPVTVEVIADYAEEGENHILRVLEVESVQPEHSCHLLDMVDPPAGAAALFEGAAEPPAPIAEAFSEARTVRVGASLVPPRDYAKSPEPIDPADYDPDTSGIIYDVAYGGLDGRRMIFVIQGYSPTDLVNAATGQDIPFPLGMKSVNVRDLEIQIEKADAETLTYRIKIVPEEAVEMPNCPADCQPSTVGAEPPEARRPRRR